MLNSMVNSIGKAKIKETVKIFREFILDENGNPQMSCIDYAFDDENTIPGYMIRLYIDNSLFLYDWVDVDWEKELIAKERGDSAYWDNVDTYVEIRTASDEQIGQSQCCGWEENSIEEAIKEALMDVKLYRDEIFELLNS